MEKIFADVQICISVSLSVKVFTFLHKKLATGVTGRLFRNLCPFKTVTLYSHELIIEERTLINVTENTTKHNSITYFFNSFYYFVFGFLKTLPYI